MSAIRAKYRELDDDPNTTWQDIDLAETRVRIEAAIDLAAETWPSCRALIEWLIRNLPAGGSGPTRSQ